MNPTLFAGAILSSARNWKPIVKECVGALLVWAAYLTARFLLGDAGYEYGRLPLMGTQIVPLMFWIAVVGTGLSVMSASLKSALPALVALFLVVPLYLLGFAEAAYIAFAFAGLGIALHAIESATHRARGNQEAVSAKQDAQGCASPRAISIDSVTVPTRLWFRLADVIQDMGNHHPNLKGSERGADLDVLGNAIKYGVPRYEGADLDMMQRDWLAKAQVIIAKHGGARADLSPVEQCVETAEKLLGLWSDCHHVGRDISV